MQWHAILGLADADELQSSRNLDRANWSGSDPSIGAMEIGTLDALCGILAAHTADPTYCFFGLCTIQGWEDSFSADKLQPLLQLPAERDHIVLAGPLSAVGQISYNWLAPNLIWPADHSWLVASEVDFDSTLVGGTTGLIEAIVESPTSRPGRFNQPIHLPRMQTGSTWQEKPGLLTMVEIVLAVVGLLLVPGEFYVWHAGVLWHEPERDPRNFPPR